MTWLSLETLYSIQKYIKNEINDDDFFAPLKHIIFNEYEKINSRIYKAYIGNIPVIIKLREYDAGKDDILNEYKISQFINEIKGIIPNFVFTYSSIGCSPPVDDKPCSSIMLGNGNEDYIIIEYVSGPVLKDIINILTDEEYLTQFIMILLSLNLVKKLFGFRHCDLHDQNIVMKKLPEKVWVQYFNYYIYTDIIPVIIDYGQSINIYFLLI